MADRLPEISNRQERSPVLGFIARALRGADEFARKPFGYENPPMEILSDVLSVPQLYRTIENINYGSPLTRGAGQARRMTEDTQGALEAIANIAPGFAAGGAVSLMGAQNDQMSENSQINYDDELVNAIAERLAVGNVNPYGVRYSGQGLKGKGYFGLLPNEEGGNSTEISLEDESGEFPAIVPTLTKRQLEILLRNEMTDELFDNARAWADARRKLGLSPFASPTELRMPRPEFAEGGSVSSDQGFLPYDPLEVGLIADQFEEAMNG